mgnify:CR=1 FL=1
MDFSIAKDIYPIVHEIEPTEDAINEAYQKMRDGDIDGRFVIKMKDYDSPGKEKENHDEPKDDESKSEDESASIAKHQEGGTIDDYDSLSIGDVYKKAVNNYVNNEIGKAAFDPHDVRYVGKETDKGGYEGVTWDSDGLVYIKPMAGQLKADGTKYTTQDYIDATRWLPSDIGFILDDGNKYRGIV